MRPLRLAAATDKPVTLRPIADRRDEIRYPGGHIVKIHRAHIALILDAKAVMERGE